MSSGATEGMKRHLEVRTLLQRAMDMEEFWKRRQEEIEAIVDYKCHILPVARLKEVEEYDMVMSADMPPFLAKVCELFVQELSVRAWVCAESHHRCTALGSDIAEAIASTESYDFLVDVLRGHRVLGGHIPATRLAAGKHRWPDDQGPQFAGYPSIPPPAPMSAHRMPFPYVPMQRESPPSVANRAKSTMNGSFDPNRSSPEGAESNTDVLGVAN